MTIKSRKIRFERSTDRDEFPPRVKHKLAERVQYLCSNPACAESTVGPHSDVNKSVTRGKAAHITAAAKHGPRFDPNMTEEQRRGIENGIWLCSDCADVVDKDEVSFPVNLLHEWKDISEGRARAALVSRQPALIGISAAPHAIFVDNQVDRLTTFLGSKTEQELLECKEAWKEGNKAKGQDWVRVITSEAPIWKDLPASTQSKVIIFRARLDLDTPEPSLWEIRQQVERAKSLDPQADTDRFEALIKYHEGDPEGALKLLESSERPEEQNLRAAIEFELGRIDIAHTVLEVVEKTLEAKPDKNALSEMHRVKSMCLLAMGNIPGALLDIGKAVDINPKWQSIRITEAIINYFSALSAVAIPKGITSWPEPIDLAFVKYDEESQSRLLRAKARFSEVANKAAATRTEQESRIWLLACLCNAQNGFREASEYCGRLLTSNPTDVQVLAWAIVRNLDVDLSSTVSKLKVSVKSPSVDISTIVALVGSLLKVRKQTEALRQLTRAKARFESTGHIKVWHFWRAQVFLAGGDRKAANKASMKATGKDLGMLSIRARSCSEVEVEGVLTLLEEAFQAHKDYRILYDLFGFCLRHGKAASVVHWAAELVSELRTFESLRVSAYVAFNAKQYDLCVKLLDDWVDLAPGGRLSREMRRLRALSLASMGQLPEAISDLEGIVHEESSTQDLSNLVRVTFAEGDLRRVIVYARELAERKDLTPEQRLALASMVRLDDPTLAKEFWRKATRDSFPDKLVAVALDLSFKLGLEEESEALFHRMEKLGARRKAGFWKANIDDVVKLMRERRKHQERLWELYRQAGGPVHFIAETLDVPLTHFYHRMLVNNANSEKQVPPVGLFARYGGRDDDRLMVRSSKAWRLYADISAILLSEHIGILEKIEEACQPIHIAAELIPALLTDRDMFASEQVVQSRANSQIFDACNASEISVVTLENETPLRPEIVAEIGKQRALLLQKAQRDGGYLVDHLPLSKEDLSGPVLSLSEKDYESIVGVHGVLNSLVVSGPVSQVAHDRALQRIGINPSEPSPLTIPKQGSSLLFHANTLGSIARSGLLGCTCERFRVFLEASEFLRLEREAAIVKQNTQARQWLDSLIEKLNEGIEKGTYIPIPFAQQEDEKAKRLVSPAAASLVSLLRCPMTEGDLLWVDDRYMTSWSNRDGAPIAGINEVLRFLLEKGQIDKPTYFEKLTALRRANVLFVPIEREEILTHLDNASINSKGVVETSELRELRRYVARALSCGSLVQQSSDPRKPANPHGETAFIMSLTRCVADAIIDIWSSNDEQSAIARAEWILQNLYLSHLGMMTVVSADEPRMNPDLLMGLSISALISSAIAMDKGEKTQIERRKGYFTWLHNRVLRGRFGADPQLVHSVADAIKNTFLDRKGGLRQGPDRIVMLLLQRLYDDLPKAIREELTRDSEFMSEIGLENRQAVSFEGLNFEPGEFYEAAAKAVQGTAAKLNTLERDREVVLEPAGVEPQPAFKVNIHETKTIGHPRLSLLFPSVNERESFLRSQRVKIDLRKDEFEQVVAEIAADPNARARIQKFDRWVGTSVVSYYDELRESLHVKSEIDRSELMPPSLHRMLDYLRINKNLGNSADFMQLIQTSAESLISELGLELAIGRLACLPCGLPNVIMDKLLATNTNQQRRTIKALLAPSKSPLASIHLIRILSCMGDTGPWKRLLFRVVSGLLSPTGKEWFDAMEATLDWTNNELTFRTDRSDLTRRELLAINWLHANKLLMCFASVGVTAKELVQLFSIQLHRVASSAWTTRNNSWYDSTHPRNLTYASFVLQGLAYAMHDMEIDDVLANRITELAFPMVDGQRMPAWGLVFDTTLADNALGSFLGGDKSETIGALLGGQRSKDLSRDSLSSLAGSLVDHLKDDSSLSSEWALLSCIIGDFAPYESVRNGLKTAIGKCDFVSRFERNDPLADVILLAACRMVRHLEDSALEDLLKTRLCDVATLFASYDSKTLAGEEIRNHRVYLLIECATSLGLCHVDKGEPMAFTSRLLAELVDRWPFVGAVFRPHVQRMCDELPIEKARHLWKLLVQLRGL